MVTPSEPLAAPQPLKVACPLGNGGVLRSQEGEGIQEGRGRWGGKKTKMEKRTRKKCSGFALNGLAITPVQLGLSERNCRKNPGRPAKVGSKKSNTMFFSNFSGARVRYQRVSIRTALVSHFCSGFLFWIRGQELNANIFFSNFLGTSGISRQNSRDMPPRNFGFLCSEGHTELLVPTPSRGRPPPTRRYPDAKVWVRVPFSCLKTL